MVPYKGKQSSTQDNGTITEDRRRVRNASSVEIDGITFRSKLEAFAYTTYRDAGLPLTHEGEKIELLPKIVYNGEVVRPMTYTPDFSNGYIYIEIKGLMTDVNAVKYKLLKHYLHNQGRDTIFLILRNKRDIVDSVEKIKEFMNRINE